MKPLVALLFSALLFFGAWTVYAACHPQPGDTIRFWGTTAEGDLLGARNCHISARKNDLIWVQCSGADGNTTNTFLKRRQ